MTGKELALALLALPEEKQNLDVCYMEECWAITAKAPRIEKIDNEGCRSEFGNEIIAIW